ncbi:hypothetical protein LCGC14_1228280 [marine sediment metagenome]|uniref:Uncharacterized protein n=1 Tax=marine sediment metagenome TaxID=412755 RepID=A0A0F9LWF7_9ZZZZ
MMEQKELEIQRALGTLNIYNIEIQFPRREEPKGLDQLIANVVPTAIRFYNGSDSIFVVEAPSSYLKLLTEALTKLIQNTSHNRGHLTWVYVHELIDGKLVHITNFKIG